MMSTTSTFTASIPKSSTTLSKTNNNNNGGSILAVSLVSTIFVFLFLIIIVLVVFLVTRQKIFGVKKHSEHGIELEDEVQNPEVDSSPSQNGNRPPTNVNALEISNPTYAIQNSKKQYDSANAGGGIYSEVASNKVYSEGKVNTKTTNTASDGQVFTGMYNLVAPLTPPVKSASEIIESAAYACVQEHSDEVYATPGELDSKK